MVKFSGGVLHLSLSLELGLRFLAFVLVGVPIGYLVGEMMPADNPVLAAAVAVAVAAAFFIAVGRVIKALVAAPRPIG
ncbi:hypothetical protein ACP70R_029786 [Stipagrostis hirtigluma subsp. patula]